MNCELPDVQAGFRKGRGTRNQIANIRWIMEKAKEFQKNIYFCFIEYTKAFVVIHTVKGFHAVNEAGVDVFLELLCFFQDPANFGNLISGSSASSKPNLYIWKFLVHILLKPILLPENSGPWEVGVKSRNQEIWGGEKRTPKQGQGWLSPSSPEDSEQVSSKIQDPPWTSAPRRPKSFQNLATAVPLPWSPESEGLSCPV